MPRAILKRFVDEQGWLHLFSKRDAEPRVRPTRVENAFVEGHLYSEIDGQGQKNPAVEKALHTLETRAEPILEKMVQAARAGLLPSLTSSERDIWDEFFIVQWKRVPDLHLTVTTDAEVKDYLKRLRGQIKELHPDRAAEVDALSEPEREKIFIKNLRVNTVLGPSKEVKDALKTRGIALLRIRAPGKSLIIGSRPVVQLNFVDGLQLMDEATEMWLPVASDLAVGVGRARISEIILDLHDHRPIRHLNKVVADQSTAFASRSEKLTRSVASAR